MDSRNHNRHHKAVQTGGATGCEIDKDAARAKYPGETKGPNKRRLVRSFWWGCVWSATTCGLWLRATPAPYSEPLTLVSEEVHR